MDRGSQKKPGRKTGGSQGRGAQVKEVRCFFRRKFPFPFIISCILSVSYCSICACAKTPDAEIYLEDYQRERSERELFEKEISDQKLAARKMPQEGVSGRDLPGQDMPGEEEDRQEAEGERGEGGMPQEGPFPAEILEYSEPEDSRERLLEPQRVIERRGTTYRLSSWETVEEEQEEDRQYGEAAVVYEMVGSEAEIPDTAEIEVEGLTEKVKMPLLCTEFYNERWEQDFEFILTFHRCDADVYELGETEICADHRAERPALEKFEKEILDLLGLPGESYRIREYRWEGEPYEDETGLLCRKARASGDRLVRDCRAVYGGTVDVEPPPSYRTKAVYVLEQKMSPRMAAREEESGIPEGQGETGGDFLGEKLVKVVTVTAAVTVSIGTILILLMLLRHGWLAGRRLLKRFFNSQ